MTSLLAATHGGRLARRRKSGAGLYLFEERFAGANNAPWDPVRWPSITYNGASSIADIVDATGRMNAQGIAWAYARARSSLSIGDFDMTLRFRFGAAGEQYLTVNFRGSEAWATDDAIPLNGYNINPYFTSGGAGWLWLSKIVNGEHVDGTEVAKAWGTGAAAWWKMRVLAVNSSLRVRVWPEAQAEPETWDHDRTDDTYASGFLSVGHLGANTTAARTAFVDDFLVATPSPVEEVLWFGGTTASPGSTAAWSGGTTEDPGDPAIWYPGVPSEAQSFDDGTLWDDGTGWVE